MGSWYRVVKTIKGHRYLYLQRTWREGKRVRTENRYLGPAGDGAAGALGRRGKPVTTTPSAGISGAAVDAVFAELTQPRPQIGKWSKGWDKDRKGEDLVERVREIDELLIKLQVNYSSWTVDGPHYNYDTDTVNVPPSQLFISEDIETATQVYYGVLLHELTHWTGHESRLGRLPTGPVWPEPYAREELVAEATAVILMEQFKIAPNDLSRHADYFQGWLTLAGDQQEALAFARREAERAAQFILRVTTT